MSEQVDLCETHFLGSYTGEDVVECVICKLQAENAALKESEAELVSISVEQCREIAKLTAELSRAREALIAAWKHSKWRHEDTTLMADAKSYAEERYKREIAQEQG